LVEHIRDVDGFSDVDVDGLVEHIRESRRRFPRIAAKVCRYPRRLPRELRLLDIRESRRWFVEFQRRLQRGAAKVYVDVNRRRVTRGAAKVLWNFSESRRSFEFQRRLQRGAAKVLWNFSESRRRFVEFQRRLQRGAAKVC
jgi:hypothetical protein